MKVFDLTWGGVDGTPRMRMNPLTGYPMSPALNHRILPDLQRCCSVVFKTDVMLSSKDYTQSWRFSLVNAVTPMVPRSGTPTVSAGEPSISRTTDSRIIARKYL